MVSFKLEYAKRPWTVNAERKGSHWGGRSSNVKEWREAFAWLALEERPPKLAWCEITAEPWQADRRWMQDTGACYLAVKAAIDGLVDAGVIPDDTPDIVRYIGMRAPQIGRDGLVLIVDGEMA